jgi:DNA invertase Pin-like site-specific DNA recombinase
VKPENKAVILARVSSKSQEDEGYSLESQVKLLENYCDNKELAVMQVFKITESASKSVQRTTFKKALAFIEKHDIKNLVIEKVDRHVRNLHDAVETHDWLISDEEKLVHFVKDSLVLHKNSRSQEWLNWGIRVVMAKNYIDNLREEAMKGWAEKLAQGWLPAVPPPGYMTVVESGRRIHVPNPATFKTIVRIFKLYLEPQQNIQSIALELHRCGVTTRKGRPLSKSAVHKMLQNPFYIGINRFDGKDYPGAQKPIISKKLFAAVQRKRSSGRPVKYKKHNPILKNMIVCKHCERVITWQRQKGKLYGSCQRKLPECKQQKFLKETIVNQTVEQLLDDLVSPSQQVVAWLTELLRSDFKSEVDDRKQATKSINQRIRRIQAMDDMLYDDKLSGEISTARYKDKQVAFQAEIEELNNKLGGVDEEYQRKYMEGISLIELSQVAKAQFLDENIDNDEKRSILTKLFENIILENGFLSVEYTKLAQAIAHKSGQTRRIYAKAQTT